MKTQGKLVSTADNGRNPYYDYFATFPLRFRAKIQISEITGCWLWTGSGNHPPGFPQHRYGTYSVDGTAANHVYAHRFAYEFVNGRIPAGFEIHHTCEQKLCVNPSHLRMVTHRENCRLRKPKRWRRGQYKREQQNGGAA
jgi:hypothetical protein